MLSLVSRQEIRETVLSTYTIYVDNWILRVFWALRSQDTGEAHFAELEVTALLYNFGFLTSCHWPRTRPSQWTQILRQSLRDNGVQKLMVGHHGFMTCKTNKFQTKSKMLKIQVLRIQLGCLAVGNPQQRPFGFFKKRTIGNVQKRNRD